MGDVFFINMEWKKMIKLIKSLKGKGFDLILNIPSDGVSYIVQHEPERMTKKSRLPDRRRFGGNQD